MVFFSPSFRSINLSRKQKIIKNSSKFIGKKLKFAIMKFQYPNQDANFRKFQFKN